MNGTQKFMLNTYSKLCTSFEKILEQWSREYTYTFSVLLSTTVRRRFIWLCSSINHDVFFSNYVELGIHEEE